MTLDPIEIAGLLAKRILAAISHGIDQRPNPINGCRGIDRGARNQAQEFGP